MINATFDFSERPAVANGFADRLLDPFRVWGV